ncbi:MAG: signal peptidase I [Chloroflexi bacterium]|nr:signal peptidase I [Chloroflexota bacterium]
MLKILKPAFKVNPIKTFARLLYATRFVVEGPSMEPTLASNQYLLVSHIGYRQIAPARGDIVVFHDPELSHQIDVKRIIGLPGEVVRVEDGQIFINGRPILEPYLKGRTWLHIGDIQEWSLAEQEYLVLGDNRDRSRDSRSFGPLPRSLIIGKAWIRYWPPESWGVLTRGGKNYR